MHVPMLLAIIVGFYPFYRAWRANRHTSLTHAVCWATTAWLAWGQALANGPAAPSGLDFWRYLALCLTGAAGVAVLGARRPHVGAWNVVVVGLLAVFLLPLAEQYFLGSAPANALRVFFVARPWR